MDFDNQNPLKVSDKASCASDLRDNSPPVAAVPATPDLDAIMALADDYANAEACAVTATSKAGEDTSAERDTLYLAIHSALAAAQPQPQPAQPLTGAGEQGVTVGLELLIAEINKLPTVRAAEIDGNESDGTPRHWRDRPHVSLRKLERLLREFFTPPPVGAPAPPEVAP